MNLVEQLEQEIEAKLDQIWELEQAVERLSQALQVLNPGKDSPVRKPSVERVEGEPREVPPRDVGPKRQVEQVDTRPLCNGCGGRMEPSQRQLGSGKIVNFLICTDSGCNNEQLLS